MTYFLRTLFLAGTVIMGASAMATHHSSAATTHPTIVLVHGAFADASSWNGVIASLQKRGYTVIATANPLRSLKGDSDQVVDLLKGIKGPVVLVGHSYGGAVISNAAAGNSSVKALVYVAGFAPDTNETAAGLSGQFPGSSLGKALAPPVPLRGGGTDLYIQQSKFHAQFAADVGAKEAELMAATQRPVTAAALNENSTTPAWKTIPSWFIFGALDKNIPAAAQQFMAKRAGAKAIVEIKGASHVVMVSHPNAVAKLIEDAAEAK
jgi:pimeloyl-ACP methyl ester carboxylesterase